MEETTTDEQEENLTKILNELTQNKEDVIEQSRLFQEEKRESKRSISDYDLFINKLNDAILNYFDKS